MLADFVKVLQGIVTQGVSAEKKVCLIDVPGGPDWRKMLIKSDGSFESWDLPLAPREHTLLSVAEIVTFIELLKNQRDCKPTVWVSHGRVAIIHDDSEGSRREDHTTIELTYSPHFALLSEWSRKPLQYMHKGFLQMLRRNFKDAIPNLDNLLTILRKATFQEGKSMVSDASRTRSSIGAECTRELKLESAELPDVILVNVSAFDDPAIQFGGVVRCLLEVDDESKLWSLVPITGECERVLDDTLAKLIGELRDHVPEDVPVVYGTP